MPPEAYTASDPDRIGRLPVLDGVRGLAALIVMIFHYTLQMKNPDPATEGLVWLFKLGWTGVDLFFVLSGFLITGLLSDAKGSTNYFRVFYARRVLRILPLYYLALLLLFGLPLLFRHYGYAAKFITPFRDQIYYWLYLGNYRPLGSLFDGLSGHLWSLAIEEQFYLVWPLVILFLSRRNAIKACVACVLIALTCRVLAVTHVWEMDVYHLTHMRLDGLAVGSALALIARGPGGLEQIRKYAIPITFIASIPVVARLTFPMLLRSDALIPSTPTTVMIGRASFPFLYTGVAIIYASILLHGLWAAEKGSSILEARPLRTLGRYSYGLYVVHVPLIPLLWLAGISPDALGSKLTPFGGAIAYIIVQMSAAFAVAWLSWHIYEKRFIRLKRYFLYDHGPRRKTPRESLQGVSINEGTV